MPTTCDPNNCNCVKSLNGILPDASGNLLYDNRTVMDVSNSSFNIQDILPLPTAKAEARKYIRCVNANGITIIFPKSGIDFIPFEKFTFKYNEIVEVSCRKEAGAYHWFVSDAMKKNGAQLAFYAPLTTSVPKDTISGNTFVVNSSLFSFHSAEKGYAVKVSRGIVSASVDTLIPLTLGKPYPYTLEATVAITSCDYAYVNFFRVDGLYSKAYIRNNNQPLLALNEQAKIKIQYLEGLVRVYKNDVLVLECPPDTNVNDADKKLYIGNWYWYDGAGSFYIKELKVWNGIV